MNTATAAASSSAAGASASSTTANTAKHTPCNDTSSTNNHDMMTPRQRSDYLAAAKSNYEIAKQQHETHIRRIKTLEQELHELRTVATYHSHCQLDEARKILHRAERSVQIIRIDLDDDDDDDDVAQGKTIAENTGAAVAQSNNEKDTHYNHFGESRISEGGGGGSDGMDDDDDDSDDDEDGEEEGRKLPASDNAKTGSSGGPAVAAAAVSEDNFVDLSLDSDDDDDDDDGSNSNSNSNNNSTGSGDRGHRKRNATCNDAEYEDETTTAAVSAAKRRRMARVPVIRDNRQEPPPRRRVPALPLHKPTPRRTNHKGAAPRLSGIDLSPICLRAAVAETATGGSDSSNNKDSSDRDNADDNDNTMPLCWEPSVADRHQTTLLPSGPSVSLKPHPRSPFVQRRTVGISSATSRCQLGARKLAPREEQDADDDESGGQCFPSVAASSVVVTPARSRVAAVAAANTSPGPAPARFMRASVQQQLHSTMDGMLRRSVGRTRGELNKNKAVIELLEGCKFGICCFGARTNNSTTKINYVILNDQMNKLVQSQHDGQEFRVGVGPLLRKYGLALQQQATEFVLFHAPKKAENSIKIYYVGHWRRLSCEIYDLPLEFMNTDRQMRFQLQFARYDEEFATAMAT